MRKIALGLGFLLALAIIFLPRVWEPELRWQNRHVVTGPLLQLRAGDPPFAKSVDGEVPIDFDLKLKFKISKLGSGTLLRLGARPKIVKIKEEESALTLVFEDRQIATIAMRDLSPNVDYTLNLSFRDHADWIGDLSPAGSNDNVTAPLHTEGFTQKHHLIYRDTKSNFNLNEIAIGGDQKDSKFFSGSVQIADFQITFARESAIWAHFIQPLRIFAIFACVALFVLLLRSFDSRFDLASVREKSRLATTIIIVGFSLAVIYHFVRGFYYGSPYPENSYLFLPGFQFGDYAGDRRLVADLNPYHGPGNYPPLMYLATYPWTLIGNLHVEVMTMSLLFLISFIALGMWINPEQSRLEAFRTSFVLTIMSYPIQLLIDRANLDMLMLPILFWGLIEIRRRNEFRATVAIAVTAAMKLIPLVYLALLFHRGQTRAFMRQIGLALAVIAASSVAAALCFQTGLAEGFSLMFHNMFETYSTFTLYDVATYAGHTIKGLIRVLNFEFFDPEYVTTVQSWHFYYRIVSIVLTGAIYLAVLARSDRLRFWQKLTLLAVPLLVFPFFSPNYKLIVILMGLFFFLADEVAEPAAFTYTILFSLLMLPKDYIHLDFVPWPSTSLRTIGLGPIIDPLLLISLEVLLIYDGLVRAHRQADCERPGGTPEIARVKCQKSSKG